MTMSDWAKKEVELACARERELAEKNGDPNGADYGCLCYESALKAYNSLMEDGHSGMSISITKNIFNRLIDGRPLFPIEDVEDVWKKLEYVTDHDEYQCKRMSSLFKEVDKYGNVTYHDNNRFTVCVIGYEKSLFYNGFICRIINKMFPLKMPYLGERYLIYIDEWTYTDKETSKKN